MRPPAVEEPRLDPERVEWRRKADLIVELERIRDRLFNRYQQRVIDAAIMELRFYRDCP